MELQTGKLANAAEEQMIDVARGIRDDAKMLAPIDTGALQKSIRLQTRKSSRTNIRTVGVTAGGHVTNPKTGRKVDYAAHQEFGTSKIPPHPFLRPAIELNKHLLNKIFRGKKI